MYFARTHRRTDRHTDEQTYERHQTNTRFAQNGVQVKNKTMATDGRDARHCANPLFCLRKVHGLSESAESDTLFTIIIIIIIITAFV